MEVSDHLHTHCPSGLEPKMGQLAAGQHTDYAILAATLIVCAL